MSTELASDSRRRLYDDEHDAFRESFRRFLAGEVVPVYPDWRSKDTGVPREVFAELGKHGFVGMQVPEELGGVGIDDFRFNLVIAEEAARAGVTGLGLMLAAENDACVPLITRRADTDLQAAWLPGLASGELVAAFVPPDRGLTAQRDGDGWTVDGDAAGIVNGGLARPVVAAASTGPDPGDVVLLAFDAALPGIGRAAATELVGPHPCDRADLRFERVSVPASGTLGGDAEQILADLALDQQLSLAAMALAGSRAALEITADYVRERRAFGQPIAEFQNTQYVLADVAARIEETGAFVDACIAERVDGRLTPLRAAAAKLRATELYCAATDTGLQLHGGYGYMLEYPIAHAYADARFLRLYGGSSESMKEIVASEAGL